MLADGAPCLAPVDADKDDSAVVFGEQCATVLAEDNSEERSESCYDHAVDSAHATSATGNGRGRRRAHGQGRKRKLSVHTSAAFAHKLDLIEYFDAATR
jgi:hypothetical protein